MRRLLATLLLCAFPFAALGQYPARAAGTPKEVIARVQTEVVAALKAPDLLERFASVGAEPVGSTPEQFVERIRSDTAKWARVIQAAGLKQQ